MNKLLVAGLLTVLLLTGNVDGAPLPSQEQIQQFQTPLEKWCGYFGSLIGAVVVDRDNRVPLSTEIATLRRILFDFFDRAPTLKQQKLIEELVSLTNQMYMDTQLKAEEARHIFEIVCLNVGLMNTFPSSLSEWR